MTINTTGDLIDELQKYPRETRIAMLHCGNQTFAPWILRVLKMYETRENCSRGEIEENVAREKSKDFPDAITVIEAGW